MKYATAAAVAAALPLLAASAPLEARDAVTASVNLASQKGAPSYYASGIIYGEPDTQNQIPDHFYTDIGLHYFRAGGAQLGKPNRGWIWGLNEYKGRFASTLSNYKTARKYNGQFQLLPHDIWGTDNTNSSSVWPGDNGNWADYDKFLNQLIADIKANNMQAGLEIDIWNEPDIDIFWKRPQQQWIDLYVRTHKRFRSDTTLNSIKMVGPSTAFRPVSSNTWFTNWLKSVVANNAVPDYYTWHLEGGTTEADNDLEANMGTLPGLLSQYGAPSRPININEYANFNEQVPSGAAWWISRFERYNVLGLRGNWLSGGQLHDFLASLIYRTDTSSSNNYFPNGEWQVYKYYRQSMKGVRVATTGSTDHKFDAYATYDASGKKVRILCGTRLATGTWQLAIQGLTSVGLPAAGNLTIQTWGFDDKGHTGRLDAPTDRGLYTHTYSGGSLTIPIFQTTADKNTAWAFEFST